MVLAGFSASSLVTAPQRVVFLADQGPDSAGFDLEVDLSIEETHTFEADLTDYPVEEGVDLTDHKRDKPASLVIRGMFTDTPSSGTLLSAFDGLADAASAAFDPTQGDRSREAFRLLELVQASKEPIDIITALRVYANMTVTGITTRTDARKVVVFEATCREIFFAETRSVQLQGDDAPAKPATKPTAKQGTKPTPDGTNKSWAASLFDTASSALGQ